MEKSNQSTVTLLHAYHNGGCEVTIYSDGTKIRSVVDPEPPVLPEQMDLKITDWCDAGCSWCHEGSTLAGKHGDLDKTVNLLRVLHPGTEIAIGGGDPLSHPQFSEFVRELRKIGLVPSVTVNGRHFNRHKPVLEKLISDGALFGVGISYHDAIPDWDYEHAVLHIISGACHPSILDNAARRKILILGYKQHGRGKKLFALKPEPVQKSMAAWFRELPLVAEKHDLSFDNLAIEQLKPIRMFKNLNQYTQQYMGQEGQYSMYIDAVEQTYGLSSYSSDLFSWSNMHEMFKTIRHSQGYL